MKPDLTICPEDIFNCKQCGDCCQGYGGTYISEHDVATIATFLNITPNTLLGSYCQFSGGKPVLAVGDTGKCVFFHPETQCTIHPVKPRMCRAWPFIETVVTNPENWEIMAGMCPGIRTDISNEDIIRCAKTELEKLK